MLGEKSGVVNIEQLLGAEAASGQKTGAGASIRRERLRAKKGRAEPAHYQPRDAETGVGWERPGRGRASGPTASSKSRKKLLISQGEQSTRAKSSHTART